MPLSRQEIEWNYYSSRPKNGGSSNVVRYNSSHTNAKPVSYSNGYTQNPQKITDLNTYQQQKQQKATKKKRKLNWRGKIMLFIITALFLGLFSPAFLRNVTFPVFFRTTPNKNVKSNDYYYLYRPTAKYLYNTDFMNRKALVGTPKKTLMTPIFIGKELTSLKQSLMAQLAETPRISEASIFVWDPVNGNYVDIDGDKPFPAASIIKIPVLISMFKAIENKKFQKEDIMELEEYYRSPGSGDMQYMAEKSAYTLDRLARLMITDSDNTATNMIMSKIGSMTAVNSDIKSWGLKNTQINTWLPDMGGTNYTTSKDLTTMLHNLDNESFLSLESRADIFDYMGHVKNNRLLAAGIPSNASIAHKTGDIGTMIGDAGIIYSPNGRKYIVAIMVKRPYNDHSAKDFVVNASKTIYDYMTTY